MKSRLSRALARLEEQLVSELETRLAELRRGVAGAPGRRAARARALLREAAGVPPAAVAAFGGPHLAVAALAPASRCLRAEPVLDWLGIGGERSSACPEAPTPRRPTPGSTSASGSRSRRARSSPRARPDGRRLPRRRRRDGSPTGRAPGLPESEQSGAGALLSQFRADRGGPAGAQARGPRHDDRARESTASRATGLAAPRRYEDPSGDIREAPQRLAGPTLVWRRGDLTLRLEADVLSKARAPAIRPLRG